MVNLGKNELDAYRALVRAILARATSHVWTLQGFGMLRLQLQDGALRLNLWSREFRIEGVSDMHTHPWHFTSAVVSGRLVNDLYMEVHADDPTVKNVLRMQAQELKPGPGGGLIGSSPRRVLVVRERQHVVYRGGTYKQDAKEIHISVPEDGTVTLNWRERLGEDVATVYWPAGTSWVSAEPRKATDSEVNRFVERANKRWDLP